MSEKVRVCHIKSFGVYIFDIRLSLEMCLVCIKNRRIPRGARLNVFLSDTFREGYFSMSCPS